jgi:TRAP-type C4-dicarboxylate transport system permease small subunit
MPSAPCRSLKLIGNLLIAASSIFFLETGFEMYFLTLTQGQQMLGFSLVHIAPAGVILLVFLSGIAFICLAGFALFLQILKLAGRLKSLGRYSTFMLAVLCVQIVHGVLLMTYDRWAAALFP